MPATTDPFVILNEAIRDLMATHLPVFAAEGRKLYAGLALILFCWFFIKSALSRGGVEWDRLASLLLFLSFGYSMTEFYATPIPGVGYSFAGLITAQASWMADAIGTETSKKLIQRATELSQTIGLPGMFAIGDWLTWLATVGCLTLLTVAVYVVISFALVAQAVLILLGPLFVPFFIVPKLDTLFWSWFRCLISYSFMQAVAHAFILVFGRVFLGFAKLYSTGWGIEQLTTVMPVLAIFSGIALVGIFKVPTFTNQIFAGMSGISFGILEGATSTVVSVGVGTAAGGARSAVGAG